MSLGNDVIEFKARFAGTPREIIVPVDRVLAIYARENGQGMAFPMHTKNGAETGITSVLPAPESRAPLAAVTTSKTASDSSDDDTTPPTPPSGRPTLKRVK
jgi:stringent starvation protein B